MPLLRTLNEMDLTEVLGRARDTRASASLRAEGTIRMLGDLIVSGLEPGLAIYLQGARRRDILPPPGTPATLTLLLEEEVLSIRTGLLELPSDESTAPMLKVAWPKEIIEVHSRQEIRVGTPNLPPLRARLVAPDRTCEALLLNLTESGMGLGIVGAFPLNPGDRIDVETELPGRVKFQGTGEVRHVEILHDVGMSMRIGLILTDIPEDMREPLQRFIQARRTDRSDSLRRGN